MKVLTVYCFFLLTALLCQCSSNSDSFPDPDVQPYRFEQVSEFDYEGSLICRDLDRDGRDEVLNWVSSTSDNQGLIHIRTHEGRLIEQVNFVYPIQRPHFLDYDEDGIQEILVPFVTNDSLFVTFVDAEGKEKSPTIHLTNGHPRQVEDGILPWDPEIKEFHLLDTNGNGQKELVTLIHTGFAQRPRGLLIHTLPDGILQGQIITGAATGKLEIADFDNDGELEIAGIAGASNNGADSEGFDDQHSYLIVFELADPQIIWSKELGGVWSNPGMFYEDFNGDGKKELLIIAFSMSAIPEETRLEFIEPGSWRTYRQVSLSEPISSPKVIDLDLDTRLEILVLRAEKEIWVFNNQLDVVQRSDIGIQVKNIELVPDMDGDGVKEILAVSSNGTLLLGPDLQLKASLPDHKCYKAYNRGIGNPPYLIGMHENSVMAFRLVKNPSYLFNRYGPVSLWVLGGVVLVAMGFVINTQKRQNRRLQGTLGMVLDSDERGIMLLDSNRCIKTVNPVLSNWFELDHNMPLEEAFENTTPLATVLLAATQPPIRPQENTLSLELKDQTRQINVAMNPFTLKDEQYWLICFEDQTEKTTMQQATGWGIMAQRVAHEIKTPLSVILMNLLRMQDTYQKQYPDSAPTLDPYTERITERIEFLRRLTRDFMKFINVEQPNHVLTDANRRITEIGNALQKNLPSDIDLELQLGADIPYVQLDQEQLQSMLENLVSNAVNAMMEGGKIIISTQMARDLQFPNNASGDFLAIEVIDTGSGISEPARADLFEPGFTTSEEGTGLGLAIVRKIVEDHQGHIDFESGPDSGTVFTVYLPIDR